MSSFEDISTSPESRSSIRSSSSMESLTASLLVRLEVFPLLTTEEEVLSQGLLILEGTLLEIGNVDAVVLPLLLLTLVFILLLIPEDDGELAVV